MTTQRIPEATNSLKETAKEYKDSHYSVFVVERNQIKRDKANEEKSVSQRRQRKLSSKSKVLIYSVMLFLNMMSFGFIIPLNMVYVDVVENLNVTRAEASLIMSITRGVMFGSGFISSWVYHMIGPIKCVAFGGIIFSIGLLVSSFSNHIMLVALPLGILSGIGGSSMNLAGVSVIANSFGRHKTVALSYSTMGAGVAGILFPSMFEILIQRYSWRGTIMIFSGLVLNTIPVAYLLKINTTTMANQTKREGRRKLNFEVFKINEFRFYIGATLLFGIFGMTGNFFLVDLAEGKGYSSAEAVTFMTVLGTSSVVGKLLFGGTRQLIGFRGVEAIPLSSVLLACVSAAFAYFDEYWSLFASCIVYGISFGVQFGTFALVPLELVGTEYFPTGFGVCQTIYGIGNIVCGPSGGAVRDITGSYSPVFYAAAIGVLVKGVLDIIIVYFKRKYSKNSLVITEM